MVVILKACSGWIDNFNHRYGIQQLSITGEKLSNDVNAVEAFRKFLSSKIGALQLLLDQIYNADKRSLFFKCYHKKHLLIDWKKLYREKKC